MNSVSPETEIVRFNDESIIVASAPDVETKQSLKTLSATTKYDFVPLI